MLVLSEPTVFRLKLDMKIGKIPGIWYHISHKSVAHEIRLSRISVVDRRKFFIK